MFRQIAKVGMVREPNPYIMNDEDGPVYHGPIIPVNGAPAQIACDEGYERIIRADGSQDCALIPTGGIKCLPGTTLQNGLCVPNPLQTAIINPVNPVIATNQPTVIDSITAKAKSSPYIALGVAGFLIFLFTRK